MSQLFDEFGTPIVSPNDGPPQAPPPPGSIWKSVTDTASKAASFLDPSKARLAIAGLFSGGQNSPKSKENDPTVVSVETAAPTLSPMDDWRVRVSLPASSTLFYNASDDIYELLAPLRSSTGTDGVIFPYTPTVSISHNARYAEQALVHSNYKSYFYEGSDVSAITISGDFTAQTQAEARYVVASIYFFRACTKMFFGNDPAAGNPPPIVFLDGYGDYYLPHISCVMTNFQHTMPPEVDYIRTDEWGRVPTHSTISVTLQPVFSRRSLHADFNLNDYARGSLRGTKGGIGGFL
jgi:hypothetical protein